MVIRLIKYDFFTFFSEDCDKNRASLVGPSFIEIPHKDKAFAAESSS